MKDSVSEAIFEKNVVGGPRGAEQQVADPVGNTGVLQEEKELICNDSGRRSPISNRDSNLNVHKK